MSSKKMWHFAGLQRTHAALVALVALAAIGLLAGCASGSDKPKPAELGPNAALISVRQAWSTRIGQVSFPVDAKVNGNVITVASSDGTVAGLDGATGQDRWRVSVGTAISAAAGADGRYAAVVTKGNQLVVLEAGRELWREPLGAIGYTAPLVAGERVFVMTADRVLAAFDARTGRKIWSYSRPGEQSLALRQAGVLLAVGDTLVAGISGRLVGLNPQNGSLRWEAPIASPRGTNDVERLVDLVGRVSRVGEVVCARAFQTAVGCVNTARGSVAWSKPASGAEGVHGDGQLLIGTESDGKIIAWSRDTGDRVWASERLKFRGLTAPLVIGRSVAVGDAQGWLHFLSKEDGSLLARVPTDGSAIVGAPVAVGDTLVVVTHNGGVFGFRPE